LISLLQLYTLPQEVASSPPPTGAPQQLQRLPPTNALHDEIPDVLTSTWKSRLDVGLRLRTDVCFTSLSILKKNIAPFLKKNKQGESESSVVCATSSKLAPTKNLGGLRPPLGALLLEYLSALRLLKDPELKLFKIYLP